VPLKELHAELESVESAKGAKRLMMAIAYKDRVDVETIAARYAIPQSTIYYWLDRLDKEPLSEALKDDSRPGRPSKLSPEQRATVADWVDKDAATGPPERNWTVGRHPSTSYACRLFLPVEYASIALSWAKLLEPPKLTTGVRHGTAAQHDERPVDSRLPRTRRHDGPRQRLHRRSEEVVPPVLYYRVKRQSR
jgi:hypothetical protein